MEYEVYLTLKVDKDNHFEIIEEHIRNALYDIDDITVMKCEVNKYE
jgi:hypothetical protein